MTELLEVPEALVLNRPPLLRRGVIWESLSSLSGPEFFSSGKGVKVGGQRRSLRSISSGKLAALRLHLWSGGRRAMID